MKIGIIGLGLIGGSIAKALREKIPDCEIVGLNRTVSVAEEALKEGVINRAVSSVTDDFSGCDFIFLCTPVKTNIGYLGELKPYLTEHTILTDAGSVKQDIHDAVEKLLPEAHFIGGHPMAGKEKTGYNHSSAELLYGCYYYVTPSKQASKEDVERYVSLIRTLDCNPVTVECGVHDFIVAAISHVPHLAAYMLVKLVMEEDTPEEYMRCSVAGGFKDTTRIASSDPTMWEQIFLTNKDRILDLTDRYIGELQNMRLLIENGNGQEIHRILESVRDYRNSIIEPKKN